MLFLSLHCLALTVTWTSQILKWCNSISSVVRIDYIPFAQFGTRREKCNGKNSVYSTSTNAPDINMNVFVTVNANFIPEIPFLKYFIMFEFPQMSPFNIIIRDTQLYTAAVLWDDGGCVSSVAASLSLVQRHQWKALRHRHMHTHTQAVFGTSIVTSG